MATKKKKLDPVTNTIINGNKGNQNYYQDSEQDQELVMKLVKEVFNTDNIAIRTDLTAEQVRAFTKGSIYSEFFNCAIMDRLVTTFSVYLVSKDRKSRKEFVEIGKTIGMMNTPVEDDKPKISGKLLGF